MRVVLIIGIVLFLVGIGTLAYPVFTTQHTENVAQIGDLKIQTKDKDTHFIPPALSWGLLALGVIMIGGGLYQRR